MARFYITGGYKGMREKYGKRITEFFDSYEDALHHKQCYGVFSLSLAQGTIVEE